MPAEESDGMSPPLVRIQASASYVCEGPMLVGLQVRADAPDMIYMGLPLVQWFDDPLCAEWTVRTAGGEVFKAGVAQASGNGAVFGLDPGDEHHTLVDLAALLHGIPQGTHSLEVEFPADDPVRSEPVALNVVRGSDFDQDIIRRVRDGTGGDGGWNDFFASDWRWTEAPPLNETSEATRNALALHLYLHRAFYGDKDVGKLAVEPLEAFTDPLLIAEAAVLRHEIVFATGHPVADKWKAYVFEHWPGLAWRIEKSEAGFGFLRTNRDVCQQRMAYHPLDEIDSLLRP